MTEWQFHGLELRVAEAQGKRRRADDDNDVELSGAGSDSTPSKGPRTSTVAAALRHRLAKAEPAGGTPVKTEPCAEEAFGRPGEPLDDELQAFLLLAYYKLHRRA